MQLLEQKKTYLDSASMEAQKNKDGELLLRTSGLSSPGKEENKSPKNINYFYVYCLARPPVL